MGSKLFTPYELKGLKLPNRVVMAPMCQYSVTAKDGKPNEWHYVHYLSRAIGGTGLIIMEMTDVDPTAGLRIMTSDYGLMNRSQPLPVLLTAYTPITARLAFKLRMLDVKLKMQRTPVAPSAIPFPGSKTPHALDAKRNQTYRSAVR